MTEFPVCVTCLAESSVLASLREQVSRVAAECGFSEGDTVKIEMAVDEACSNVAEHAYAAGVTTPMITLQMELTPEALTIHVIDQGRGGRPEDFQVFETIEDYCRLERSSFSGLGLLIMSRFMDEIKILSSPVAGTHVILRKNRIEAA